MTRTLARTWPVLFCAAASVAGCTVGQGTGAAQGTLFVVECKEKGSPEERNYGTPEAPEAFDLAPEFFAGETFEDIGPPPETNRLVIRVQRTGRRRELNDVLSFDIPSSYEVARCVRGRSISSASGQVGHDYDVANCAMGPNGPRLRVAPDALVRAFLIPRSTCSRYTVATANSPRTPGDQATAWQSWIDLVQFGSAAQPDKDPASRDPVTMGFKVDLGQRLHAAAFHLVLEDDRVVKARLRGEPLPAPQIGGVLDGFFDFDLERGQGGQTFP